MVVWRALRQRAGVDAAKGGLAAAEAGVRAAQSRLMQAHVAEEQAQAALRNAQTAPQQISAVQARAAAAEAHAQQMRAQLAQAELNLEHTTVKTPVRGLVSRKTVEAGIAAATGARFALLPPENATGNFVKVVQRVPVKIVLDPNQDPEHLLRPGLSADPTVYTK